LLITYAYRVLDRISKYIYCLYVNIDIIIIVKGEENEGDFLFLSPLIFNNEEDENNIDLIFEMNSKRKRQTNQNLKDRVDFNEKYENY